MSAIDSWKNAGITPILHYLDNVVSNKLIVTIKEKKLQYQLASPHDHRLNPAERAIQTFKNHFICNLHDCDKRCPKYLWCRFIPQTVMTSNMLRQSCINPKLSAHGQFFGTFNYDRTPLAPLVGTKVIIHEKLTQRASYDPHGKEGWLTGPAYYRQFKVAVANTGGQRVSDTIEFLPTKYNMPKTSLEDCITRAIEELSSAIKYPQRRTPFLNGDATNNTYNTQIY